MTSKSAIRPLRPTHLVALRALDSRPTCVEWTAPTWPRVHDGDARLPLWSLLSHSMASPTGYRRAWVHCGPDGIDGIAAARARCGGLVWDVRHIWVDGANEPVARELLLSICEEAAARGARRVFVETGTEPGERAVAQRAGFEQYTQASLYVHRGGVATVSAVAGARLRQRGDEHALFQLYKAAVPANVRAAEAMTLEEWAALHKGTKRWAPASLDDRRQHVWPDGESLLAWMELTCNAKSQHVEWLMHPAHESASDALVALAIGEAGARGSLYATCRDYQPSLCSALERAQFALVVERAVFARQLAVRVPERVLVAARARPTLTR
jgi:hypothetical protein